MIALVLTLCVLSVIACGLMGMAMSEFARDDETLKLWYCVGLVVAIGVAIPHLCYFLGRASQ